MGSKSVSWKAFVFRTEACISGFDGSGAVNYFFMILFVLKRGWF
jgi:hypothetical protein